MRIALDIKNMSKITKPSKNDVIVYDGKEYYVTTKQDLLKEAYGLVAKCQGILEELRQDNLNFKAQTSKDIKDITDTAGKLLELKGDNL